MAMGFRGPGVFRDIFGSELPSNSPYVLNVQSAPTQAPAMPNVMSNLDGMQAGQGFAPSKSKLFGDGGKGWMALGLIGDALQSASGGQATYAPMAMDMQQVAAKERMRLNELRAQQQAAAAKRFGDQEDWLFQQNWSRNNPGPTEMQRNYEWLQSNHPGEAQNYLSRQTNDVTWRQGADGQWYAIQNPSMPSKPVGKLTPLADGGAGGNASGNFPR